MKAFRLSIALFVFVLTAFFDTAWLDAAGATPSTKSSKSSTSNKKSATKKKPPPSGSASKRSSSGSSKSSSASKKAASSKKKRSISAKSRRRVIQQAPDAERIREIQQALRDRGYDAEVTGSWDQRSVQALSKFQADQNINNLSGRGKLDSLTLIALGLGPKYDQAASTPKPNPEGHQP